MKRTREEWNEWLNRKTDSFDFTCDRREIYQVLEDWKEENEDLKRKIIVLNKIKVLYQRTHIKYR